MVGHCIYKAESSGKTSGAPEIVRGATSTGVIAISMKVSKKHPDREDKTRVQVETLKLEKITFECQNYRSKVHEGNQEWELKKGRRKHRVL